MFTNIDKENFDFPHTEGFNRMLLDNKCKEQYGFTEEEFTLLKKLYFFDRYELVPYRKNGKITERKILLQPFCVALYDCYYGAEMVISNSKFHPQELVEHLSNSQTLIKSIVLKYSKDDFGKMF